MNKFKTKNITLIDPTNDCVVTVQNLLKIYKPKIIYDIGAYKGNWTGAMINENSELKESVMFEPQIKYASYLKKLDFKGIKTVIYNFGLGSFNKKLQIKGGTSTASFFEISNNQHIFFPGTYTSESEISEIKKLDNIFISDHLPIPDLIKIDVQGYELEVLKGALQLLRRVKYLVIELSFTQFYKNQPKLSAVFNFLEDNNFQLVSKGYEWWSKSKPSILLQMDGIFKNTKIK